MIDLIWYLFCKNPISRSEMVSIYQMNTNLVDSDFQKNDC